VVNGFLTQMLWGTVVTLELAFCALFLGLAVGLLGALLESIPNKWLRYIAASFIFIVRGLPELLVLFFIYFGLTAGLTQLLNHYVEVSAFAAGVIALGLIFGAYASQVFRGAFMTLDYGQIEAGKVLGLSKAQLFLRIQLPQAWRHALPGLSNLWLILLKDTAIVTLIGLNDMMNEAKLAATTNHQPFTYYLLAALIYLLITTLSQSVLNVMIKRANRYV
jgi:His/Glu/Gln/Arg/opine family amino acid ABC transporter permease subunit